MAATFRYRPDGSSSEGGENGYAELAGIVTEADDQASAAAAAEAELPLTYNGFPRQPIRLEEIGGGIWYVRAPYRLSPQQGFPPVVVEDGWKYSYDTGEVTVHVTHGIEGAEYSYAAVGEAEPAYLAGAINMTTDGVQGTEVSAADGKLTRRRVFGVDEVSADWLRLMQQKAFGLNVSPWNGWQDSEVLYKRTSYTDRNNGEVEVTQEFRVGQNLFNVNVMGFPAITKRAHDYAWVEYVERAVDVPGGTAKKKIWAPVALRTVQLYPYIDFATLEPF